MATTVCCTAHLRKTRQKAVWSPDATKVLIASCTARGCDSAIFSERAERISTLTGRSSGEVLFAPDGRHVALRSASTWDVFAVQTGSAIQSTRHSVDDVRWLDASQFIYHETSTYMGAVPGLHVVRVP